MKELELNPGEELMFKLEGDVFGGGANPLLQAALKIYTFILKILGTRVKSTLVVTSERVLTYYEYITCYIIPTSRQMKVIMPSSVMEVGYGRVTVCGCFPYYTFHFQGHTEKAVYPVKGGTDEEMIEYVNKFYNALNK